MRYLIEHETHIAFPEPVWEHVCELRLTPRNDHAQRVHAVDVEIDPKVQLDGYIDCFENLVRYFSVPARHDCLSVTLRAEVETLLDNPFDYDLFPVHREQPWLAETLRLQPRLWAYLLHRSSATPDLATLTLTDALELPGHDTTKPVQESVAAAMEWITDHFDYDPDVTHVHSSLQEVVDQRAGVCQDFAHLMIALARSWGYPARYAMGYLDPGYFEEGVPVATHAWAEVLLPGAGWRGFDATHRLLANDSYVRVAVGRDYRDAAPLRGSFKGNYQGEHPEVSLRITRQQ